MDLAFGICGILAGPLMAAADILLDLKGKDNQTRGKLGLIDSAWTYMDAKRFWLSILLAMIGVPLQMCGFIAMTHQLAKAGGGYALAFGIIAMIGCSGSFFIHTLLCLFPIIYKFMQDSDRYREEEADAILCRIYDSVKIPFWVQYLCLVGITGLMIIAAMFLGYLPLSPWWGLLTAPVLTVFGMVLRKLLPQQCCDLPGIVMPSLGVGAVGLLAVLAAL